MLVLTRKVGEEIVIGNDIRLTVTAVGDGRVKVGISAPRHVRVDRSEVAERVAAGLTGTATPRPQLARA
jgi:carbon storage regulator